jgi:uncharacterized protein YlxW (UPF0749 family)
MGQMMTRIPPVPINPRVILVTNLTPIEKQRRQRGSGGPTDSRQRRLEKNRESARESRKRKKGYISSLEQKVAGLESEVNRLRNLVQNFKEREKLSYFSHLDSMD